MDILVDELIERIDAGESVNLLDVRDANEHAEFNIGGILIPVRELILRLEEIEFDKSSEIVVYCRSGVRSRMAQMMLSKMGFDNVRNLEGGMLEWQRRQSLS